MASVNKTPTHIQNTRVAVVGDLNARIASSHAALLRSRELLAATAGKVAQQSKPR